MRPHPQFTRQDRDIYYKTNISLFDAVLGGKITVPTLDSPVSLKIPPGTQNGQRFRLKGKGVKADPGHTGDQYVEVSVDIPKNLTSEAKDMFESLKTMVTPKAG